METIKLIKFISGEEVIATVISEGDDAVNIKKAILLGYHRNEGKATLGVSFHPFMPYTDDDIVIYKHSIACITIPKDDMANEYRRAFSDIIIAPANTI